MKERPILFSGAMVRAILEGRKTQTRRAMKKQPQLHPMFHEYRLPDGSRVAYGDGETTGYYEENCPYGRPGDRLWVREAWFGGFGHGLRVHGRPYGHQLVTYRADFNGVEPEGEAKIPWKPSIHMPRNYSRLLLEITAVRIERLQAITEADAFAEGVQVDAYIGDDGKPHGLIPLVEDGRPVPYVPKECTAREFYAKLWCEINGKGAWDANPFVWVVEFKVVEGVQ